MESGATIDGGRVTLDAPLGEGGQGSVYRGRLQDHIGPVAVKLLRVDGLDPADRTTLAARLRDEASAAERVVHPNLVRILASGDCPERGPYIVYELVEGGSLEERLKAGPLPWEEVEERLAPQLLGALKALHDAGIVHRDVKPDNIFVTPDGRYLLGDLGLAVFDGRSAATATGVVVGTPGYLAPERVTNPDTSPSSATDVYAAAMVLVRAVAGRLPFTAVAPAALVHEQLSRNIPARTLEEQGLPPGPARVLASALDLDPKMRPETASDLLAALSRASRASNRRGRNGALTRSVAPRPRPTADRAVLPPPRRRPVALGLALALGVVLILTLRLGPAPLARPRPVPSPMDDLSTLVTAARPLLPDSVVERVLAASAASRPDEVHDLVRSVALAAGTTSPAGMGVRLLLEVESPGQAAVTARGYGALLRSAPARLVATSTALLTALMVRSIPYDGEVVLDDLALTVCSVQARSSQAFRDAPPGRGLRLTLDALLARSTTGGMPPAAREAMAVALSDPSLGAATAGLDGALALQVSPMPSPAAFDEAARRLAEQALLRSDERNRALQTLATDRLSAVVQVSLGATGEFDAALRAAGTLVVEDWYRLGPLVGGVALPPPPTRLLVPVGEQWYVSVDLMRRHKAVDQRSALSMLSTGPFRGYVLACRLGLGAVVLAERAALGDPVSCSRLVRDGQPVVDGLHRYLGPDGAVFSERVTDLLSRVDSCRTASLVFRANLCTVAGRAQEARALYLEASSVAVAVAQAAGPECAGETLDAVRHTLRRVRQEALTAEQLRAVVELEARARRLATRLEARPERTGQVSCAAVSLLQQLGKQSVTEFLEE